MNLSIENICLVEKFLGDPNPVALAHCCNCQNTMKSGVAKVISEKIPQAVEADRGTIRGDASKLGSYSLAKVGSKFVYNLYGQYYYGYNGGVYLDYKAFENALNLMKQDCVEKGINSIYFPYKVGCARAGGDWEQVLDILFKVWYNTEVEIILCRH